MVAIRPVVCALLLACAAFVCGYVHAQEDTNQTDAATASYAAAAALQNRELYDLAAEEWSKFLERHADDERADLAHFYRGACHLQSGRTAEAEADFRRVVAKFPQSKKSLDATLNLGIALFRSGQTGDQAKLAESRQLLTEFVEKHPESAHRAAALFYLAESQFATADAESAAASYQQFLREYPQHELAAEVLYGLGVAQQSHDDVLATFELFLRRHPKHRLAPEVRLRLGESLASAGKPADAERYFAEAASTQHFELADLAYLRCGECQEQQGRLQQAADSFVALRRTFPDSRYGRRAALGAARCFYALGEFAQVRAVCEPLVAPPQQADGVQAAHWMLLSLVKENRPPEAVALAERLLPQMAELPGAEQIELDRADALRAQPDRQSDALAAYERLAEQHAQGPIAARALHGATTTAGQVGEHERVLAAADRFARQHAESPLAADVEFAAAESLMHLARYAEAQERYQRLLSRFDAHAQAVVWRLRLAWSCYLDDKPQDVLAVLSPDRTSWEADSNAEAWYLIGLAHAELGQADEARRALTDSLSASDSWQRADETLLELARIERQIGDTAAAAQHLEKLLKQFPQSTSADRATLTLGELEFAAANYDRATAWYRRLLEQWPASSLVPQGQLALAWAGLKQRDAKSSIAAATRLIDSAADSRLVAQAHYVRALARYEQREFPAAIDDLQQMLSSDLQRSQISDAKYALALCEMALDRSEAAISTLTTLLHEDPDYASADRARYELAWALHGAGQTERAAEAFAKLAELHPQSALVAEALYQVGTLAYDRGQFQDAAKALRMATDRAGETALAERAMHKLAWSMYRQEELDAAAQAFADQVSRWPAGEWSADASFMRGEILFKQGRFAEVIETLAAVEQTSDPEYGALALLHAGQAAAQLKDFARSSELLKQGVEQFPQARCLPELLYELAWATQNLDQTEEALRLYELVTTKTDREVAARARFMVGEICFERADHREAVRNFFKVAYGYNAPHWQAAAQYEAGRCFEVLGKKDQALQSYQEVVEKYPQSEQAPLAQGRLAELR